MIVPLYVWERRGGEGDVKGGAHKESVALKAIEERIFVFFF